MACAMGDGTIDDALKALILSSSRRTSAGSPLARCEATALPMSMAAAPTASSSKFETSDDVAAGSPSSLPSASDIAMQVAAANPSYLNESDVPEDVLAKEKEIVLAQMANDPKTANKPDAIKRR